MSVKISIIIPCYNHGKYLEDCINSISQQSFKDWEAVIIDDGSTDDTAAIAKKLISDKVHYVFQQNKGLSGARNTGIEHSTGKFIVPLDADDKLEPQALEKCITEFNKNPDLLIVYGNSKKFGTEETESELLPDFSLKDLLLSNRLFCTAMYQRKDIGTEIRYDENMKGGYEDWEFWIQLKSKFPARPIKKIEGILFYYRSHEVSMIKEISKDNAKKEKLFDYMFEKHQAQYRKFYPSYIQLLNRKTFYEHKLENIYNSKFYRTYNSIMKIFR